MIKEQEQLIHKMAILVDSLVVVAAFVLAFLLRDNLHTLVPASADFLHRLPDFKTYAWILIVIVPLWIIFLQMFGIYQSMRERGFFMLFRIVFKASLIAVLIFSALAFLLKLDVLSRAFIFILFICSVMLLTAEKWAVLKLLRLIRENGYNYRVILIVGSGERARNFAKVILENFHWGIRILGFIDEKAMVGKDLGCGKVIGSFEDFSRILDENVVDEVVFLMPRKWLDSLEIYIKKCEKVGVKATIAVDFYNTSIAKPIIKEINGWPLLTFDSTPSDFLSLSIKRTMDFILTILGFVLCLPVFFLATLLIKLTSPGPVFFKQERCGLNGRKFAIYKFRTMVQDAEKKIDKLKNLNEVNGPVFKIKDDPRITWFGRILRKTSLDELPQLINVFKGDMSLVGPRPPIPTEVYQYERWQRRRLSMRPGITCIHEVVARNDGDFENWIRLDLEYIDNWSLGLDFKILLKTFTAVIRGTGC
jgi:exopolysaccharide biosynthesis polyprenyl glycosylphosphotransferase